MRMMHTGEVKGNGAGCVKPEFAGRQPDENRKPMVLGEGRASGMDRRDSSFAGMEMRRAVEEMPPAKREAFRNELQRCKEGLMEMHREYGAGWQ